MAQYLTFWMEAGSNGGFQISGDFDVPFGVLIKFGPEGWIRFRSDGVHLTVVHGQQPWVDGSLDGPSGTNMRVTLKFAGAANYSVKYVDPQLKFHGPEITTDPYAEP
jgi:hypothetical protein